MSELTTVTLENVEEILRTEKLLVLDFGAEWCGPCKRIGPIVEKFVADNADAVEGAYVDVGTEPVLAQRFGVMGVPTVIMLRGGNEEKRFGANLDYSMLKGAL